ncbi:hypothetical protein D3C80_1847680 [compost metagenome]
MGTEEGGQAEYEQVGGDGQQYVTHYRKAQADRDPLPIRCGRGAAQPSDKRQDGNGFGQQCDQGIVAGQCIYIEGGGGQGQNHQVAWTRHGRSLLLGCLKHRRDPGVCW